MPPIALSDLEAFAAVARHRSFRQAALERGVSPSLLSQVVRRLEDQLGVQLLHRTTRSVTATQAGEMLLSGLEPAFAGIAQALDDVRGLRARPAGRVRINAPLPVVHLLLAPIVADFLAAYPEIELEISSDNALIDVLGSGFDAGVRFGEDLAQDMVAVPLHRPSRRTVVASPAHIARAGRPDHPQALTSRNLIAYRFPRGTIHHWEFARNGEAFTVQPRGNLTVNDPLLAVRAAVNGAGFAWLFDDYVRPEIEAGRLVSVLDDWRAPTPAPFLYFSSRRNVPPPLRAFIDFVRERAAAGDGDGGDGAVAIAAA